MDYEILMNKIDAIDSNALLVTVEDGEYIDVSDCKNGNCNKNKWSDNGYNSYMRIVNEVCVCTDCLAGAEQSNKDLADVYFDSLINNPDTANEFLSAEYLKKRGFYRAGGRVHAVGFYKNNDNVQPEKVLEAEQKDGNDVIFEIVSRNPFECEYRWYVRKTI